MNETLANVLIGGLLFAVTVGIWIGHQRFKDEDDDLPL